MTSLGQRTRNLNQHYRRPGCKRRKSKQSEPLNALNHPVLPKENGKNQIIFSSLIIRSERNNDKITQNTGFTVIAPDQKKRERLIKKVVCTEEIVIEIVIETI